MAGAVWFTCNEGNAIKIARADMPPTFLKARTEALASADSQTALRGRTDFFRLNILDT